MKFFLSALCSLALTLAAFVVGSASSANQQDMPSVAAKMKLPPSFLPIAALPNSLMLLPPPPEPGSAAFARDEAAQARGLCFEGHSSVGFGGKRRGPSLPACRRHILVRRRAGYLEGGERRAFMSCSARCGSMSAYRPIAPRIITNGRVRSSFTSKKPALPPRTSPWPATALIRLGIVRLAGAGRWCWPNWCRRAQMSSFSEAASSDTAGWCAMPIGRATWRMGE